MTSISFAGDFTVPAPLPVVWPALQQVDVVAGCMPGATLTGPADHGGHQGELTVRFGPTTVRWRGVVQLRADPGQHQILLTAQGKDQRGQSRARANVTVDVRPEGPDTRISLVSELEIAGVLAPFASTGGEQILRTIMDDFQANLAGHFGPGQPVPDGAGGADGAGVAAGAAVTPRQPAASELNALRYVFRAIWDGLRARLPLRRRERAAGSSGQEAAR